MNPYWIQAVRLSLPPYLRIGCNSPCRVYRQHCDRGVKNSKKYCYCTSTAESRTLVQYVLTYWLYVQVYMVMWCLPLTVRLITIITIP